MNWNDWFLASDENTEFLVSQDCSSCDSDNNLQSVGTKTALYMSANIFGMFCSVTDVVFVYI